MPILIFAPHLCPNNHNLNCGNIPKIGPGRTGILPNVLEVKNIICYQDGRASNYIIILAISHACMYV